MTPADRAYHRARLMRTCEGHRRRARDRGCEVGPVDGLAVIERDHWTCHLCEYRIDPASRWQQLGTGGSLMPAANQWVPSLDHVIPLGLSGPHTMENLRAAHFGCNAWAYFMALPDHPRAAAWETERANRRRLVAAAQALGLHAATAEVYQAAGLA